MVMSAPSVLHRRGAGDGALVEGERGGVHGAVVLEVEEQAVAAGGGQLGVEVTTVPSPSSSGWTWA